MFGVITGIMGRGMAIRQQEGRPNLEPSWIIDTLKSCWTPGVKGAFWRILTAVMILAVGFRLARWLGKFLKKTFDRTSMEENVRKFLMTVLNACMYALVIFIAAEKLGVPSASIVALMGSAGVAIGLSLKESLSNVAGGILILVTRPFVLQDYIVCGNVEGTVEDIGLVYTSLITVDNRRITIPNGTVANATIINVTAQDKRQLDLEVNIDYKSDLKKAKEILLEILENHPQVIREDGVRVFVKELGSSAVILGMRGWIMRDEYWPARWDIIESIKFCFDEAGIVIPYKQVTIHREDL